jgi:competence protein ComEA
MCGGLDVPSVTPMRRQSPDEVAEAAHRRLELLGRELARSGLEPVAEPVTDGIPEAVAVPEPGRHARDRAMPVSGRGVAWLQDRLPASLRGRVTLWTGHVAVLAAVAAVALAVTAYVTIRARPTSAPVPEPHTSAAEPAASAPAVPSATPAAAPGPTGPEPSGAVVVDVAGKVRRPGVATLPAGSRVVDAIRKAGGARPGVDLTSLNLARVLVDGEQILVGVAPAPGVAASASSQPGAASADGGLVNLNTATLAQLDSLPGVGPVTAQKILDWRTAHGAFTAVDELLEVDGIGEKTLADMAPHLTL